MGQDIPPAPPEAEVIRLAREATGMTAQSAAEASRAQDPAGRGVSAPYWRDVERGHGGRRGERVPTRASARVLAAMARVVGVEPRQLAGAGREDAARVLGEILRREDPAPAARAPAQPLSDDEGEVSNLLEASRRLGIPVQDRFEQIMQTFRQVRDIFPPGEWPPGVLLFEDPQYAEMWDSKIGQTFADGQPYTPARLAFTVAMAQVRAAAEQARRGGTAAGLTAR